MIPDIFIESWHQTAKWQSPLQVEQDLVISRALVSLYNNEHIKDTLIFRGGTALNKLFITPAARYSEDLDFVQKDAGAIGRTIDVIRQILKPWLGEPKWKITEQSAKLIYRYEAINKLPAKLKIEINIKEHFQALPLLYKKFNMKSEWFTGMGNITTHELDELIATKLRALYQRRKGRDLFDVWYVVTNNLVNLDKVLAIFAAYCNYNKVKISGTEFIKNLTFKKDNLDFKSDMNILLPAKLGWNFAEAYQFVIDNVISKLL